MRKISLFIPAGLSMMSAGLIFHHWFHTDRADLVSGIIIGMALALMTFGLVRQKARMLGA